MGGRSAYTLATALFIGGAGLIGYFAYLYVVIPKAAIFTILIFIGLEITAQSFQATPRRHYAALALACVPAMAKLVMVFATNILGQVGRSIDSLAAPLPDQLQTMQVLASGFILTSLLWASALAAMIDRRLRAASVFFSVAGLCSLFGVIHSPFPDERLVVAWRVADELPGAAAGQTPLLLAVSYLVVALMLFSWGTVIEKSNQTEPTLDP
jgi:AGZA family xanthine/uracil permease-like MFS transporter